MIFRMEVEIGNDAMSEPTDLTKIIFKVSREVLQLETLEEETGGTLLDLNGNTVGKWSINVED